MRKSLAMLVVATAISTYGWSAGQKDHEPEKLTGTVKSVDAKALAFQIETADKKIVALSANLNTKIASGDAAVAFVEIRPGARVVVTTEQGKTPKVAVEIQLAELPVEHH